MGGFFGVVSSAECVEDIYYGTDYHSHLGTRRGGMAMSCGSGVIRRRIHDISNTPFRTKFGAESLAVFKGCNCGIGVISDDEDQPLVVTSKFGTFAIITVGRINNIDEIIRKELSEGLSHLSEYGSGEPNPTEVAGGSLWSKVSPTPSRSLTVPFLCCCSTKAPSMPQETGTAELPLSSAAVRKKAALLPAP